MGITIPILGHRLGGLNKILNVQDLEECTTHIDKNVMESFPGGAMIKNLPANAGDTRSSPDPGRSHMPRSN